MSRTIEKYYLVKIGYEIYQDEEEHLQYLEEYPNTLGIILEGALYDAAEEKSLTNLGMKTTEIDVESLTISDVSLDPLEPSRENVIKAAKECMDCVPEALRPVLGTRIFRLLQVKSDFDIENLTDTLRR